MGAADWPSLGHPPGCYLGGKSRALRHRVAPTVVPTAPHRVATKSSRLNPIVGDLPPSRAVCAVWTYLMLESSLEICPEMLPMALSFKSFPKSQLSILTRHLSTASASSSTLTVTSKAARGRPFLDHPEAAWGRGEAQGGVGPTPSPRAACQGYVVGCATHNPWFPHQ